LTDIIRFFGNSDKPSTNEYGVKLVDQITNIQHFSISGIRFNYPSFEKKQKHSSVFLPGYILSKYYASNLASMAQQLLFIVSLRMDIIGVKFILDKIPVNLRAYLQPIN